jgi:hypothetical protein
MRRSVWVTLKNILTETQTRRAEREIARFSARHKGLLTALAVYSKAQKGLNAHLLAEETYFMSRAGTPLPESSSRPKSTAF